jgi:hypothetical protein
MPLPLPQLTVSPAFTVADDGDQQYVTPTPQDTGPTLPTNAAPAAIAGVVGAAAVATPAISDAIITAAAASRLDPPTSRVAPGISSRKGWWTSRAWARRPGPTPAPRCRSG